MNKHLALALALLSLLFVSLACAVSSGGGTTTDLSGTYDVKGTNFDGSPYQGTVVITKNGNDYNLAWDTGSTSTGTGTLSGNTFSVKWTSTTNDTTSTGKVTYTLQANGSLVGTWTIDGVDGQGTETLTKQ